MSLWIALLLGASAWLPLVGWFEARDGALAIWLAGFAGALVLLRFILRRWMVDGPRRASLMHSLHLALRFAATACAAQFLAYLACERLVLRASAGLPWVASTSAFVARAFGFDATADGGIVLAQTNQHVLAISATAEKLGMPLLAIWLASGLFAVFVECEPRAALRKSGGLLLLFALYAQLRLLVLIVVYREYPSLVPFWGTKWLVLQFLPLAMLAGRVCTLGSEASPPVESRRLLATFAYVFAVALTMTTLLLLRTPHGGPRPRVLMDDMHSDWAWSNEPFRRDSFTRRATYSYSSLAGYLEHFFDLTINRDRRIDDALLREVDVLIIKTPTESFLNEEIDSIERFVAAGGGLFLIGDHTNLFGMTTNLNPLASRFGIEFVDDDTFALETGSTTKYAPTLLATHPVSLPLDGFEFETSCTVRGPLDAEPVMTGFGLGREFVDYGHINFFGNMKADLRDGYGTYSQALAVEHESGRVLAFADSTVLSNFSLFKPGHAELCVAGLRYLAASARPLSQKLIGWGLLVATVLLGVRLARAHKLVAAPRIALTGAASAIALSHLLVAAYHQRAHALPEPPSTLPIIHFDSALSNFRLLSMVEVNATEPHRDFAAFFVNTQRLSLIPRVRPDLDDSLRRDEPLLLLNPLGGVRKRHARGVVDYLRRGGRMLVLVPQKGPFYSANALLSELGVWIDAAGARAPSANDGRARVLGASEVTLPGQLGLAADAKPDVYTRSVGRGAVTIVVGSERFSREELGPSFNAPDAAQRTLYALQYYLIEEIWLRGWPKLHASERASRP